MSDKISVLVVEDNASHAELISHSMMDEQFIGEINSCENISDAKKILNSSLPSIIITDLNLPDGKGDDLINYSVNNRTCPVILMTSYGDEKIAAQVIKSGAYEYVVKSAEAFVELPSLVKRVVREWQLVQDKEDIQASLLLKEKEQDEILDSMIESVFTINQFGEILSYNRSSEKLFGYTKDEIIGGNVKKFMPEAIMLKHDDFMDKYLKTGDSTIMGLGFGREIRGIHKDGSSFPMRISVA